MASQKPLPTRIHRSFKDLSDETVSTADQASILAEMGWTGAIGWSELLRSPRVLIVSEAGAGKTYECGAERDALWGDGEPAFLYELASLADSSPADLMNAEEQERFDAWRASQSDIAIFFLDSIDELKLSLGSFETALRRLNKALAGQLGRTKIVITTRPTHFDLGLIQKHLPIPEKGEPPENEEAFADIAMNRHSNKKTDDDAPPQWRHVALMPLTDLQIREMAELEGVSDPDALLADIRQRDAEDFARRPLDLIELCVDWRDYRRIRTHREQIENNVAVKLKPRTGRPERSQLSAEKALEGASRLAIATLLTRKFTLRHSAEADKHGDASTALDPASILLDWTDAERATLLERALFGFAGYGRVRFHHRSVIEYLAALRLGDYLGKGMSIKAVKRLLFSESPQQVKIVKPTMRPVAAWLACSQSSILTEIRNREPEVLLDYGDPASLTPDLRIGALRAYTEHYGPGTWRGMRVPRMQVHRFASEELGPEVLRLWNSGIENSEVRELLMVLAAAVPMKACADIAYSVVMRTDSEIGERIAALDLLLKIGDARLDSVTLSMASAPDKVWPNRLLENFVSRLFPKFIDVQRLCSVLARIFQSKRSVNLLNHLLAPKIADIEISSDYLEAFREGLTNLIAEGLNWNAELHHVVRPKSHMLNILAAVCLRQVKDGNISPSVIYSSVLALRLARNEHEQVGKEPAAELRKKLGQMPASVRKTVFWADDAFCQSFHPEEDPWKRFYEASYNGPIQLTREYDADWVLEALVDPARLPAERAVMLEAAMRNVWNGQGELREYLLELKDRVAVYPELIAILIERLKPTPINPEYARLEEEHQKHIKQTKHREAKDRESWIRFRKEVAERPDVAFGSDQSVNTAWNLWHVMGNAGEEGRSSGWNRRFIERHFSKDVADRMRLAMMTIWRNHRPSLRTERPQDQKDTYLRRWQLGLAAIAAEAEDPRWALKLSRSEAELATRYAPLELNGFPSWLESLVIAHPNAVEAVLGPELTSELELDATQNAHRILLQNVEYAASTVVELFLPRIQAWFDKNHRHVRDREDEGIVADRLHRSIEILLKNGDKKAIAHIRAVAADQLAHGVTPNLAQLWLPTLMRLNPIAGVEWLEQDLRDRAPSENGRGVEWVALLFGDRHQKMLIDLSIPEFTPSLLLRLVRLAYKHVRSLDDAQHEGVYSPGLRDDAEQGRWALLSALLNARGQEGWKAKLEMAHDPLIKHFRDRALMIMREKAAEEVDSTALSEAQVVALDRFREAPPVTRDELFALLVDRLDDIDDLLLRDDSPRAAWALITDEKVMRRTIARELSIAANRAYTVDQESVTADEKETDIRLRAASADQQAAIELKLGDRRTARDLRDTIKNQLVTKYMAPDSCRSGCLLVTIKGDRTWRHPESKKVLDVVRLESMLQAEALKVETDMGGAFRVTAKVLDLRSRLSTEKALALAK